MSLAAMTVIGIVVLAGLTVVLLRVRRRDMIGAIIEKRRASTRLATRGDYVEGVESIPVAMSLTETTFYYENPDLEASFDLSRVDEIEYSDELATGRTVEGGYEVLRLRAHGTAFDFMLEKPEAAKWKAALPERTLGPSAKAV